MGDRLSHCCCNVCGIFSIAGPYTYEDAEAAVQRASAEGYSDILVVTDNGASPATITLPAGATWRAKPPIPAKGVHIEFQIDPPSLEVNHGFAIYLPPANATIFDGSESLIYRWSREYENRGFEGNVYTQKVRLRSDWPSSADYPEGSVELTHQYIDDSPFPLFPLSGTPPRFIYLFGDSIEAGIELDANVPGGLPALYRSGSIDMDQPIFDALNRPVLDSVARSFAIENTGEVPLVVSLLQATQSTDFRPDKETWDTIFSGGSYPVRCKRTAPTSPGTLGNTPFFIEAEIEDGGYESAPSEALTDSLYLSLLPGNEFTSAIDPVMTRFARHAQAASRFQGSTFLGYTIASALVQRGTRLDRRFSWMTYDWGLSQPAMPDDEAIPLETLLAEPIDLILRPLAHRVAFTNPEVIAANRESVPWVPTRCRSLVEIEVTLFGYLPTPVVQSWFTGITWSGPPIMISRVFGRRTMHVVVEFDPWGRGQMPDLVVPWNVTAGTTLGAYEVISVRTVDLPGSDGLTANKCQIVDMGEGSGGPRYRAVPIFDTAWTWDATIRQARFPLV